jgi:hypothetical protein
MGHRIGTMVWAGLHIRQTTLNPYRGYAIGPVYVGESCAGAGIEFVGI